MRLHVASLQWCTQSFQSESKFGITQVFLGCSKSNLIAFTVTVGCLVLHQRYKKRYEKYLTYSRELSNPDSGMQPAYFLRSQKVNSSLISSIWFALDCFNGQFVSQHGSCLAQTERAHDFILILVRWWWNDNHDCCAGEHCQWWLQFGQRHLLFHVNGNHAHNNIYCRYGHRGSVESQ